MTETVCFWTESSFVQQAQVMGFGWIHQFLLPTIFNNQLNQFSLAIACFFFYDKKLIDFYIIYCFGSYISVSLAQSIQNLILLNWESQCY